MAAVNIYYTYTNTRIIYKLGRTIHSAPSANNSVRLNYTVRMCNLSDDGKRVQPEAIHVILYKLKKKKKKLKKTVKTGVETPYEN